MTREDLQVKGSANRLPVGTTEITIPEGCVAVFKDNKIRLQPNEGIHLVGDGAELTPVDDELTGFEKALETVMKDAMGLVGGYISPLYVKEQAKYLRENFNN